MINYNKVLEEIEQILSQDTRFIKKGKSLQLAQYASYTSTFDDKWLGETKHGNRIELIAPYFNRDAVHVWIAFDEIDEYGIKVRIEFDAVDGNGEDDVFFGRVQTSDQFYQLMIMLGVFKDE